MMPENVEQQTYTGPERRKMEFASPGEQSSYDARGLIVKARKAGEQTGVAIRPADLITREEDNVGALSLAIGVELKNMAAEQTVSRGIKETATGRSKRKVPFSVVRLEPPRDSMGRTIPY